MAEAVMESGHLTLGDNDIFDIDIATEEEANEELDLTESQPPTHQASTSVNQAPTSDVKNHHDVIDDFDFQLDADAPDTAADTEDAHASPSQEEPSGSQAAPRQSVEPEISYEENEAGEVHFQDPQPDEAAENGGAEDAVSRDEIGYEDDHNAPDVAIPETGHSEYDVTNFDQPKGEEDQHTLDLSGDAENLDFDTDFTAPAGEDLETLEAAQSFEDAGGPVTQDAALPGRESKTSPLDAAVDADGEEDTAEPMHPLSRPDVRVIYNDVEYELCATEDNNDPDTYFFAGDAELDLPLSGFLSSLRQIISDEIHPDDELVARIEPLQLEIGENASQSFLQYTTFREVLDLYHRFEQNDGVEFSEPVVHLIARPDSEQHFSHLQDAANSGVGLRDLPNALEPSDSSYEDSPVADAGPEAADELDPEHVQDEYSFDHGEPDADAQNGDFQDDQGSPEAAMTDAANGDEELDLAAGGSQDELEQPLEPGRGAGLGENGPADGNEDQDEIDYQDFGEEERQEHQQDGDDHSATAQGAAPSAGQPAEGPETGALNGFTGNSRPSLFSHGKKGGDGDSVFEDYIFDVIFGETSQMPSLPVHPPSSTTTQTPGATPIVDLDLIDYSDDDEPSLPSTRHNPSSHVPSPSQHNYNTSSSQNGSDAVDDDLFEEFDLLLGHGSFVSTVPIHNLEMDNASRISHANLSPAKDLEEDTGTDDWNSELPGQSFVSESNQLAPHQEGEQDDQSYGAVPQDESGLDNDAKPLGSPVPSDAAAALRSSPTSTVKGDEVDLEGAFDADADFSLEADAGADVSAGIDDDVDTTVDVDADAGAGASQEHVHDDSKADPETTGGASGQEIDEIDWENDGDDDNADGLEEFDIYQVTPPGGSAKRSRQPDDHGDLADESDVKRRRT